MKTVLPKILLISPSFGGFGGIEAFVLALAEEMDARGEVDLTVAFKRTSDFKSGELMIEMCAKATVPIHFINSSSAELFQLVRAADLVHCQNACVDVALAARFYGKPLALTIHNWSRGWTSPRGALRMLAFHLAQRHWYNSDFVWNTWEPRGHLPTSAKLPIVSKLPSGIVAPEKRKGFVFVSRWIENKGLETLVDAYARAKLDRTTWPLELLGDGPLRPAIERRIAELGVTGIRIHGRVDNEVRNEAIRHAKWMVTPPNTKEDFGLTPIEARYVGVPCIITRDGGLPEAGGKHALMCEPNDPAGLAALLERAAAMPESEYVTRAEQTRAELLETLQPLSVYNQHYRDLLASPARFRGFAVATLFG